MSEWFRKWGSIWLKPVDARRYAWVRVGFGVVAFANIIHLWQYRASLYSSEGIIDGATAAASNPGLFISVFGFISSPSAVSVSFLVAAAAAALLVAGIWSRAMLAIVFLFMVSATQRAPISAAGWDFVLTNFAFVLLFSPLGEEWRAGRLWRSRGVRLGSEMRGAVPRYGLVLIQVQVAVIYWQAVFRRWDDPYWRDGEFLTYFLLSHHGRFPGMWVVEWHGIFEMLTYVTMLLELVLPVLLWVPKSRALGIFMGVAFHLGIAVLSVNIALFSFAMVMTYLAFLGGRRDKDPDID